jgi:hypothetical protein
VADKEFRILAAPFVGTCMLELPKGSWIDCPSPAATLDGKNVIIHYMEQL